MEKRHKCKENKTRDVRIVFDKINAEESAWVCEQTWYASEVDAENGKAENVGDIISFHIFPAHYCPFCGCELKGL